MAIREFTDLVAWQKAHRLVLEIYSITRQYPNSERFGLASQMQRSAISITSNLAEGFSRRSVKEKLQFYYMSAGSLSEIHNQLIVSRDVGYIKREQFDRLRVQCIEVSKLLQGLIRSSRSRISP